MEHPKRSRVCLEHYVLVMQRGSVGEWREGVFVLSFVTLWLLGVAVATLVPAVRNLGIELTAASVAWALSRIGWEVSRAGALLTAGGRAFVVDPECTPLLPIVTLGSGIAASRFGLRVTVLGLGLGGLVLWAINVVRVVALVALIHWPPALYNFMHTFVWQSLTVMLVYLLFLGWLRWAKRGQR